ncbi:flagellar hook-length control protein FliK [Paenibacillus tuaregi]|uniref:flagellar hook-length control protein FliK n=1 Tax=Paenibacillus tuaregi TaxID=1816681 RepID=UPI0008394B59|nr:flagellar hook-length control protein FliK [Paenibacillus tuaregi]
MSLIMNSSMGNTAPASAQGQAVGKAAQAAGGSDQPAQGAAPTFNQTLVQMLLGALGGQAVPVQATNTASPQGTMSLGTDAAGQSDSESAAQNTGLQMLSDLLQGVDSLDEAIAADPSMMAMLQGWLQQLQSLIQQMASAGDQSASGESDASNQELPVIAQHAETLRFAVQDGLQQLFAQMQMQPETAGKNLPQIQTLLQTLGNVLPQNSGLKQGTGTQATSSLTGPAITAADLSKVLQGLKDPANANMQGQTSSDMDSQAAPAVVMNMSKNAVHKTDNVNAVSAKAQSLTSAEEDSAAEGVDKTTDANAVVTAGQLQMKDSGVQLAKPVQAAVHVEQFAKEMSGFVVNKLEFVKQHGMTEATISLFPEHLGQVDVKITMQNGHLIAQFATEHAFAKDSLEQQMNQLRSALQAQGIQVEKLEVTQNQSLSSHMYHDGRQPGSGTGQQKNNGKQREATGEDALAAADMTEEWNEWIREVRSKEEDYGSSFVARA